MVASSVPKTSTNASASRSSPASSGAVETLIDGALGQSHCHDCTARERGRPLARTRLDLFGRDDAIDEPDRQRLIGANLATRPDELLRARDADEPRQTLRPACTGDDAEQDLGLAEASGVGGDAQVTGERASSRPPPSAKPRIAAMTGRGMAATASNAARNCSAMRRAWSGVPNSSMSAPAASAFSLPQTTTAFTSASSATARLSERSEHRV